MAGLPVYSLLGCRLKGDGSIIQFRYLKVRYSDPHCILYISTGNWSAQHSHNGQKYKTSVLNKPMNPALIYNNIVTTTILNCFQILRLDRRKDRRQIEKKEGCMNRPDRQMDGWTPDRYQEFFTSPKNSASLPVVSLKYTVCRSIIFLGNAKII